MFLEALLAGGSSGTVVEEGSFSVTNSGGATIPCQTNDYDYLIAYRDPLPPSGGMQMGYYYEHFEADFSKIETYKFYKLVSSTSVSEHDIGEIIGNYIRDVGWTSNGQVVTTGSKKGIKADTATGTWHYKAIKFNS